MAIQFDFWSDQTHGGDLVTFLCRAQWQCMTFSTSLAISKSWAVGSVKMLAVHCIQRTSSMVHIHKSHNTAQAFNKGYAIKTT
jgi:hypothetical protein